MRANNRSLAYKFDFTKHKRQGDWVLHISGCKAAENSFFPIKN